MYLYKMRKYFLIIVISVFLINFCEAQRFDGGVLLGLSASQIDGDRYAGFHKAGLAGGVWVNTRLDKNFTAQIEIKYIGKGSAPQKDIPDPDFYRIRLQYIELPVIIRYNIYENLNIELDIEAGTSVGYLIAGDYATDRNGYLKLDPQPNEFELATQIGINFKFSKKFSLDVRHSYSVMPIRKFGYGLPSFISGALSNNIAVVSLYYQIGK